MSEVVMPVVKVSGSAPALSLDARLRAARRVRLLSWASLFYMAIEGGVGIAAGIVAGSIALIGFGLDSVIEGFASVVIIWRFTGHRIHSEAAERRAQKLVAVQFFVLAPYVAFEATQQLWRGEHPDTSWVGIALAATSAVTMPYLGIAKQRLAERLGSPATKGEGRQNMLCAYLAGALLIGLSANAIFGAWWLDPAVGLLIAIVAVKEGREAWRGEGCTCAAPVVLPDAAGSLVADGFPGTGARVPENCGDDCGCDDAPK